MRSSRFGGAGHEMIGTSMPLLAQPLLQRIASSARASRPARRPHRAAGRRIDPSIAPGTAARSRAPRTAAPARRARARGCARIISGQPPGSSEPRNAIASGTHRHAVGSAVPVQSNSRRKRERSVRGEFAPWLIDQRPDARPAGRGARAGTPRPSARRATCGSCRCSRRRRAPRGRAAACPGACAPSTSVSMPRARSSRDQSLDREAPAPVGLVT